MASPKFSLNCAECRARKVKCDRGNPCSNCRKRGSVCQNELLRKPNRSRFYGAPTATRLSNQNIPTSSSIAWNNSSSDYATEGNGGSSSGVHVSLPGVSPTRRHSNHFGYTGVTPSKRPIPEDKASAKSLETQSVTQDLNDILFSNELLSQLFGTFDDTISIDVVKDGVNSLPSLAPPNNSIIAPLNLAPVPDTLCISRFNRDAGNFSLNILIEYRDVLPRQNQIDLLRDTFKQPTALSSNGSSLNTVLDIDPFVKMLHKHGDKLLHLDSSSSSTGLIDASEVFYVVCALFYASSVDKSSNLARDKHLPFIIKLNKQLTGLNPSLMLMQACRLWFMGCMMCNLVEEAAAAIAIGGRTAVSMGIHKYEVMIKQPAQQRSYFIDVLINLVCDGCFMRAVFAVETPVHPASLDSSIFHIENHDEQAVDSSIAGVSKPMPLILRLHASTWIFIGRYYHRQGRLRVPTEQDLTPPPPVNEAEVFETSQLDAISIILHHCALELERPLSLWLSFVDFQDPSCKQQWHNKDSNTAAQSNRALQMLYLIRYYRILINYPFIHIKQDSLEAVVEAARSTINTTWRLARRGAPRFQDNLVLYGHICLRAVSFLAACRSHQQHLKLYPDDIVTRDNKAQELNWERSCLGPDKMEQVLADLELGVDALDKLDRVLDLSVSLASLASDYLRKTSAK